MSKSTSTDIPKYSSVGKLSPDDPFLKSCGISSKMRRFVHRMRLRADDLDLAGPARASEFDDCSETMGGILGKKKISTNVANKIVAQTLDAAADHLLEYIRQDQLIQDLERSKKDRERLINHFRCLGLSISKLPPVSKGKLNEIIAQQNWQHFDMEMFSELMHAMQEALSKLSPERFANDARFAIRESLRASKDPVVDRIVRTAPPAITELWGIIPAATRSQVEADIRRRRPPKRGQVTKFLNHLVDLLKTGRPAPNRARRRAIQSRYLRHVAKLWRDCGLNVGRAFAGDR